MTIVTLLTLYGVVTVVILVEVGSAKMPVLAKNNILNSEHTIDGKYKRQKMQTT